MTAREKIKKGVDCEGFREMLRQAKTEISIMDGKKKTNYWLIAGVLIVGAVGMYHSYLKDQYKRNHGVYTIATITKKRPARNGWKVESELWYRNHKYEYGGLVDWEVFSFRDKSKRFFTKILEDKTADGYLPVFVLEVPDSIQSAPLEGWSEAWMKANFPEVVADVYDTR